MKKSIKKLKLNREALQTLNKSELQQANGGALGYSTAQICANYTVTCPVTA